MAEPHCNNLVVLTSDYHLQKIPIPNKNNLVNSSLSKGNMQNVSFPILCINEGNKDVQGIVRRHCDYGTYC